MQYNEGQNALRSNDETRNITHSKHIEIVDTEVCRVVIGGTVETKTAKVRHQARYVAVVYALSIG